MYTYQDNSSSNILASYHGGQSHILVVSNDKQCNTVPDGPSWGNRTVASSGRCSLVPGLLHVSGWCGGETCARCGARCTNLVAVIRRDLGITVHTVSICTSPGDKVTLTLYLLHFENDDSRGTYCGLAFFHIPLVMHG